MFAFYLPNNSVYQFANNKSSCAYEAYVRSQYSIQLHGTIVYSAPAKFV